MAEWSNAAVLKTVDVQASGGSNPSSSAIIGLVVKLVIMPPCHGGVREFESRPDRKKQKQIKIMNKELIKGLFSLLLLSTLAWSLNLNFGIVDASWLEIFGAISLAFMIGAPFILKNNG